MIIPVGCCAAIYDKLRVHGDIYLVKAGVLETAWIIGIIKRAEVLPVHNSEIEERKAQFFIILIVIVESTNFEITEEHSSCIVLQNCFYQELEEARFSIL